MSQHHNEEEKNPSALFYVIGLLAGMFTGFVLDGSFIWIPVLGIVGLLFAGFFLNVFVRGRGEA